MGLAVSAGTAVDTVKLLRADLNIQMVRQTGEKPQDRIPLVESLVIEQLPVGGRTAVLPPQVPRTALTMGPQGIQAHLLVVAQEHDHVGRGHDPLEDIHSQDAPVDHILENVHLVRI